MALTLYGSLPSVYVRRIRMLMDGIDYEFKPLDVYDDATREQYTAITPIRKLPVLVDGDQTIFDSHVISQYLIDKHDLAPLTIEQSNLVSAIDGVTDSMIILFMGKRSELPVDESRLLFKLQLERIPIILTWLQEQAQEGEFKDWHFATIALISLLDWAEFRGIYDFSDYPALLEAKQLHAERDIVKATMPEAQPQ